MKHKIISVRTETQTEAKLYSYFLDNYKEIDSKRTRPVVIICPGGGYQFTSEREAEAVALQFAASGYHACVLYYSTAPVRFPQALCELAWSVNHLREYAAEYGIKRDKVFVLGFSAGGHLAASLGTCWQEAWLEEKTHLTAEAIRPNGLILSYPVITSGEFAHRQSFQNLIGENETEELLAYLSLEKRVTKNVPPVFIWHTCTDESVPLENTLLFITELRRAGVSIEAHIYPEGRHGLSLAGEETMIKETGFGIQKRCQSWVTLAREWIQDFL